MIKINLLPQNLRKKEIVQKIPLQYIIVLTILVFLTFHILLGLIHIYKKTQFNSLNTTWNKMQPQFKDIDILKKNLDIKRDKAKAMEYVLKREIFWTDFLSIVNQAVPKGLWLNHLSLSANGLIIEGSVFSFGSDEVTLVNKFFNELKNKDFFSQNLIDSKLASVQRRNIKEYEVLDFLLTADVNKEKVAN